jgi:hypothetical protein
MFTIGSRDLRLRDRQSIISAVARLVAGCCTRFAGVLNRGECTRHRELASIRAHPSI